MRVAVIGSRGLMVDDLGKYLPDNVTEIVSGGARGVDSCARSYAQTHGIKLTNFSRNMRSSAAPHPSSGILRSSRMQTLYWLSGTEHPTARNL